MKVRNYFILFVFCFALFSCKDDKTNYDDVSERVRMTMFAWRDTGFPDRGDDEVELGRVSGRLMPNKIFLLWHGVEEAVGYHVRIRMSVMGGTLGGAITWTYENCSPEAGGGDFIIDDPKQVSLLIEDLQYGTPYRVAIRTLSSKGVWPTADNIYTPVYEDDPYHSHWYGYGDASQRDHNLEIATFPREGLPEIITYQDRTETSVRINFVLAWDDVINAPGNSGFGVAPESPDYIMLNPFLEFEEGPDGRLRFVVDHVSLIPTNDPNATIIIPLTEEDKTRGYLEISGLTPNVQYIVNLVNSNIWDHGVRWNAYYNTQMIRMRGPTGDPIVIPHELYEALPDEFGQISNNERVREAFSRKYNAARIDLFIDSFMDDTELAEGTVFMLEAGKTYFIENTVRISKGLTLKGPDGDRDNRPIVLMGGIHNTEDGYLLDYDPTRVNGIRAYNFSFGRPPRSGEIGSITLSDIIIENIRFEVPNWYNYDNRSYPQGGVLPPPIAMGGTGTPNYFINQDAQAMAFNAESFQLRNCDFQGMGRGFIRIQGASRKIIEKFVIDNCLIYNCGAYDDAGSGYPFIAGDGTRHSNIFQNISITNTTIVSSPYGSIFGEGANPSGGWPAGYTWDVTFSNNTLINHSPRSSGRPILALQNPPPNSKFTVHKNLIIICPSQGEDATNYYCAGMLVGTHPEGIIYDFFDNYSTDVFPGSSTNTSIFTSHPFNNLTTGAGTIGNVHGATELEIKLGYPSISPWELMIDPYPAGRIRTPLGHKHNVPDGLYFRDNALVRSHPIVTREIGAPRWRERL